MKDFKLILIELFETEQFGKLKEAVQNCIEEKEGLKKCESQLFLHLTDLLLLLPNHTANFIPKEVK